MDTVTAPALFTFGLSVHAVGALASLACRNRPKLARLLSCWSGLLGVVSTGLAGMAALVWGALPWTIPSGLPIIEYRFSLDALSAYFALALSIPAIAVSVFSFGYLKEYEHRKNLGVFGFLFNLLLLSIAASLVAANTIVFLIAWEIMAISAFGLVSFEHEDVKTRAAGILYFIMSHADTACLLLAFGILMGASGGGDFASFHGLASRLSVQAQAAALLLFLVGFGIKSGIIPLHIWLPSAHPVAPSNVSALLSGIVIKTGIYGLFRVYFDFFDVVPSWLGIGIMVAAVASALLGVLYALMQHDLKRLLAYHSIENIGIILLGFGAGLMFRETGHNLLAALAVSASLFHTLNHAVFKSLLFMGAGSVLQSTHTRNIEKLGGLTRRMPWTSAFFLVGSLAISGLPPLNGFVSEWLTYQSLLAGYRTTSQITRLMYPIAGALLALTGALAAACFVKAFGITFLALPRSEEAAAAHESDWTMLPVWALLAALCAALGIGSPWFRPHVRWSYSAAARQSGQREPGSRGQQLKAHSRRPASGVCLNACAGGDVGSFLSRARRAVLGLFAEPAAQRTGRRGIAACRG